MADRASLPTLSVVIASRDRAELLGSCLESVRRCQGGPYEVIVVDSASRDPEATARVAGAFGAHFIRTDIPGAGHARNIGALAAGGEVVAFTDDDATVDTAWADALRDTFGDASVDAVVGPVFIRDSDPREAMAVGAGIDSSRDHVRFTNADPQWFERLAFGSIGFGANLAVRVSAFRHYGTFSTCLGAGAPIPGDENHFLLCLVSRGGSVVNDPRARVTHPPQPPGRLLAMRRATLAYVLYLLRTQPRLFPKVVRHVMRRFLPARSHGTTHAARPGPWPLADLAHIVSAAPGLLLAAWKVERRLAAGATIPDQP